MKRPAIFLLALVFSFLANNTLAQNTWYKGAVKQVFTSGPDGSFYAVVDNQTIIDNCAYKRVLFRVTDMGVERTKAALAMAMASVMSGKSWGVVIDMPEPGSVCYASATTEQGAMLYNH